LAVWLQKILKYLASCSFLNMDWPGDGQTAAADRWMNGNCWFVLRLVGDNGLLSCEASSWYPSQPSSALIQRWQYGRVSSHLTRRILIHRSISGLELLKSSLGALLARSTSVGRFMVISSLLWLIPSLPTSTPACTLVQRRFDCSHRLW